MVSWSIAGLGLVVALVALVSVRRLSRKHEALTQAYWELRYDYTRLRSQVSRLDPETAPPAVPEPTPPASVSFVPLSSMKKKDK